MMKKRHMLAAALVTVAGAALAQQGWTEVEDGSMLVEPLAMTVDELDGASVYDPSGERIGELDDVLMGGDGGEMAVSLDVGGFLGMGEKDVLIMVNDLSAGANGLTVSMSKEELEALPEFED